MKPRHNSRTSASVPLSKGLSPAVYNRWAPSISALPLRPPEQQIKSVTRTWQLEHQYQTLPPLFKSVNMANTNHSDVTKEPAGQTPAPSRASSPGDYLDVPGQRALPTTPVRGRDATKLTTPPSKRSNSDASGDVSMNDIVRSGTRGSSASGTTTPGGRKRAKKPPQKFSCTDFPPCDLHFTRSEHLARHIR